MFNFDIVIDRKHTDSQKWRKYDNRQIIPMWVADMDFRSPPAVLDALHERVEHGVFGYASPDPQLKATIVNHLQNAYGWQVAREWIIWLPGLVTGINLACRCVGPKGAGILTHIPVYPPFLTAPALSQKQLQTAPLVYDGGRWQLDWDALQRAMTSDRRTALFLLCNPQNPTGRVFNREELTTLAQMCLRNDLVVCADEIHCDLILEPSVRHTPFATLDAQVADRTITLMAPSKSFNIPGLGCAFAVISNPKLRQSFKRAMEGIVPHVNIMGFVAAQAAYTEGWPWMAALLDYLRGNRDRVIKLVNQLPGLHMGPVEGTYLAWIDTRGSGIEDPVRFFENAGVGLSDGAAFGTPGFVRLNFACPRASLTEALARVRQAMVDRERPQ
jgi:cysteine-S-conjugate beta-lyase